MKSLSALTLLLALAISACSRHEEQTAKSTPANSKPRLLTTFYPTTYFAQRLVGDFAEVICPLPPGQDPTSWMPNEAALREYQSADLIFVNGAGLENWLDKVSLPKSRLVDTAKGLAAEFIVIADAVKHQHGPEGEHSHEGTDGRTWVDPINAQAQAKAMQEALVGKWPAEKARFESALRGLQADLDELDRLAKEISAKLGQQAILASHPVYNYLARRHAWNLKSMHFEPNEMPSEEALADLSKLLGTHPAKIMLWEGEPKPEIAAAVSSRFGLKNLTFSPCESVPPEELAKGLDYLARMKANFARLAKEVSG